jgi:hypothetical protein
MGYILPDYCFKDKTHNHEQFLRFIENEMDGEKIMECLWLAAEAR